MRAEFLDRCSCGAVLMFSARARGDGMCGPCYRTKPGLPHRPWCWLGMPERDRVMVPNPSFFVARGVCSCPAGRWGRGRWRYTNVRRATNAECLVVFGIELDAARQMLREIAELHPGEPTLLPWK